MPKTLPLTICENRQPGAHPGGGGGVWPPWDLKNTRFLSFLLLNYVIYSFAAYVLKLFAVWGDRGSVQHGKELT